MDHNLDDEAHRLHAYVSTDEPYQRLFRVRQARWSASMGIPIGEHRGRPLGSRIAMPEAKDSLCNYLTDRIRGVVRDEVIHGDKARGKLYGEPRIFNDLLSSQPMCFNLFGELALDLDLATRALADLTNGRVHRVTAVTFEHSPGRGNPRYTGDRSAFDVFVEYVRADGGRGFLGVEVKYHENLNNPPGAHRTRYEEIAQGMGVFRPEAAERLREKPLQQVWRDHLLAGSLLQDTDAAYVDGAFVFLYPNENTRCRDAVAAYAACLIPACTSFLPWTLEALLGALQRAGAGTWLAAFEGRYLGV